jgi:hypothetical protein
MTVAERHPHRYAERASAKVLEASPEVAVVEQAAAPELENHVGVRHASALYVGAFEASRALVLEAAGEHGARLSLEHVEIAYEQMPIGVITSRAERAGEGWEAIDGNGARLETLVTSTNEAGKTVARLSARWRVER